MTAIGFDPGSGALVIQGADVYPARTLTASLGADGTIDIVSTAGPSELYLPWQAITDLSGNAFASQAALMAYLQNQFTLQRPVGETFGTATVAAIDLVQGMPVAVSRANGQLVLARADTYVLSFVAGVASLDTSQGFANQPAHGAVTLADWTAITGQASLSSGLPYFLAPTGGLTVSPLAQAATCVTRIGLAASSTTLIVSPSDPITL